MPLRRFILDAAASLEALYPPHEARSLVLRLCEELLGWPTHLYVTEPEREIPADRLAELQSALARLQAGEPLQYVTGVQEFYGRRFRVTPDVLIPRQETEMLVEHAIASLRGGARILDLCTGSGCIAWTLALELPGAQVTGVDISGEALAVARKQFGAAPPTFGGGFVDGKPEIAAPPIFVRADVLAPPMTFPGAPFDLITANPPYIRESERAEMHRNVLEHEPALALFVPDDDPLLFYRAVASWALRFLKDGGPGLVEINEALGEETAEVFRGAGLKNVAVFPDLSGRDRFVKFSK